MERRLQAGVPMYNWNQNSNAAFHPPLQTQTGNSRKEIFPRLFVDSFYSLYHSNEFLELMAVFA